MSKCRRDECTKPLCQFSPGTKVRIEDLPEGCKARGKLYAMGLIPGTVIEVVSNGCGPCQVRVRGTNVVLGHGMARQLTGEECSC